MSIPAVTHVCTHTHTYINMHTHTQIFIGHLSNETYFSENILQGEMGLLSGPGPEAIPYETLGSAISLFRPLSPHCFNFLSVTVTNTMTKNS